MPSAKGGLNPSIRLLARSATHRSPVASIPIPTGALNPRISWNLPGDRDASGGTRRSVWAGISDARGRLVRRLLLPGSPTWDGTDGEGHKMPSGRYFVRLKWEGGAETCSVVLVR